MIAKFYIVGGFVRDKLCGKESKDVDFAVEADSYEAMKQAIVDKDGDIFLENPEFLTIRGKLPNIGAADFVLCRKESDYSDGRRPDNVEMGTLLDDLSRRDFTMNAIAQCEDGTYIDPFNGRKDLKNNLLKCVGKAKDRMDEDPLRLLRAVRFMVTKNFLMDSELFLAISDESLHSKLLATVSSERIREELTKCFSHNTSESIKILDGLRLLNKLFSGSLKLMPTFKKF